MSAAPLLVAVTVSDPALAERLVQLLASMPDVRLVKDGEAADVAMADPKPEALPDSALTQREFEVLALLAEGASNKTIARRLGISPHTAKFHVGSVIDKLDATGRTDAVAHAARIGVIQL